MREDLIKISKRYVSERDDTRRRTKQGTVAFITAEDDAEPLQTFNTKDQKSVGVKIS